MTNHSHTPGQGGGVGEPSEVLDMAKNAVRAAPETLAYPARQYLISLI